MTSSPIPAARSQYLFDLLAQVPDPRKRRGRRHALAGLLAVGIAAVIAGSRSFAAIGQWAADAGPEVLTVLGAARGPAEESTFRRAFALVSADVLDGVLGAWLHTRAVQAGGRLVIAIDGKTVRGAKSKSGKAPHLVHRVKRRCAVWNGTPNEGGRSRQAHPLASTYTIAVNTWRSGSGAVPPPWGRGRNCGRCGWARSHSSSGTSRNDN
jgi:hypothetical protein